jgi:hypothetical protein
VETFDRILKGETDYLPGYEVYLLEITGTEVLRKSNQKYHPILHFSGNENCRVKGILYDVTNEEFSKADECEVSDYKRVEAVFTSGKTGFIYVKK